MASGVIGAAIDIGKAGARAASEAGSEMLGKQAASRATRYANLGNMAEKNIKNETIRNAVVDNFRKKSNELGGKALDHFEKAGIKSNSIVTPITPRTGISGPTTNSAKNAVKERTKEVVEEGTKKASSGIGKNSFIGGAVGSVAGAGVGGIVGMATGADEDDMKSMVVLGALGGATAGAGVGAISKMARNRAATGSMFSQELLDIASDMSKNGGKNLPAGGGANGVLHKAGTSVQNFGNKLDDIGENISNKISKGAKKTQTDLIKDIKRSNPSMTTSEILNDLRNSEGIYNSIYKENVENISKAVHKGNTIGGAVQGSVMGSATGALIGGVAGGIDEDETFIGGALKGGFIGGALGGAGGAVSGYFNNSAKLLANTTSNVNSLFK